MTTPTEGARTGPAAGPTVGPSIDADAPASGGERVEGAGDEGARWAAEEDA